MPITKSLLSILACPENKSAVNYASVELVERLNAQIGAGTLKNRAGALVREKMDGALIRADGKVLYPIIDDIPVMLIEEGIEINP